MKLEGEYIFDGPREDVWELVRDPDVLATALPGPQSLEQVGENEYEDENMSEGSTIFGFGGEYARNIGTGVDINLGLTYYTGSANGGNISLSGFQLTGGLVAAF